MTDEIWQTLAALFRSWTGMVVPDTMRGAAVREILCMAGDAGSQPMSFLRSLNEDGEARQEILDRIGLGTTWFLREQAGLLALVDRLGQNASRQEPVTIWSAGCSSGEEPYSLAMALLAAGVPARILATDLNRRALWRGIEGRYSRRALARLPAHWRTRYFEDTGLDTARVTESLRRCVTFELHNLRTDGAPPPGWHRFDAVVCRNVLLYFERDEALEIVDRLAARCRPGGYLLLSAVERPLFWMSNVAAVSDTAELVQVPFSRPASPGSQLARPSLPFQEQPEPGAAAPGSPVAPDRQGPASLPKGTPAGTGDLLARAAAAEETGRMDEALALLDTAVTRAPLAATAHLARGLLLKRVTRTREAIDAFRAARFLDAHAWLAPYQLALCLEAAGEHKEAEEAYRHALGVIEVGGPPGLAK
ncbi:MAG TPA: CheR family methyltransferase, partial [Haliangium sp.]|nr:CheR family methyltransferase [Haliangium sp.]